MHTVAQPPPSPAGQLPLSLRPVDRPAEVLPAWWSAQLVAARHALRPLPSTAALRSIGFLPRARAERIAAWYTGPLVADPRAVETAYAALARDVEVLAGAVAAPRAAGGLGIAVTLDPSGDEPYDSADELCFDVRERGAMQLRSAAAEAPHPVMSDATHDGLRLVHDVLGHAALGLGFDLQSEYAAWLYLRPLFSAAARPAAFCELAAAVAAHVLTGVKHPLRADLPPAGL